MIDWPVLEAAEAPEFQPGNLEAKFVAPPFSVLDTRQGYWQERRRAWLSIGIKSELGRDEDMLHLSPAEGARARWGANADPARQGGTLAEGWTKTEDGLLGPASPRIGSNAQRSTGHDLAGPMRARMQSGAGRELESGKGNARSDYGVYATNEVEAVSTGTSIFDPVLCELMYRWFAPEGGSVLDPFAGGSVRGIVASMLGHAYTGVDLSLRQLEANRAQVGALTTVPPTWLLGDSRELDELLPAGLEFDMVFTCPPYYDLEVYSKAEADLSNAPTYGEFMRGYSQVIDRAAARLADQRFMVLVVSEIRDPDGYCRGLVPDTIAAAHVAGLRLYNEAVLVNSAGTLPLRVTKYMEASRKLGRAHQNVLVFIKGKPPRGWSYERPAPPSPQLSMFEAEASSSAIDPEDIL